MSKRFVLKEANSPLLEYYLLGFENGKPLMGTSGQMIVHQTSERKRQEAAEQLVRGSRADEVYGIGEYTQEMSEMSGEKFYNYVKRRGKKYI